MHIMKSTLPFILVVLLFGCTATRLSVNPMGEWAVTVSNTPYGEMTGVYTVAGKPKSWDVVFLIQGDRLSVSNFIHDGKTGKATGNFYFQGNAVSFESQQNGDEIVGTMSAGGMDFPFKGKKK